ATAPSAPADAEALLAALDPEQREVAGSFGTPLCVLAGAGTGKTRAITHRIAYGVATGQLNPRHVLAVTFTAKAAAEMRSRLRDLGVPAVQARPFHAAAPRQLRHLWPRVVGRSMPPLLPDPLARPSQARPPPSTPPRAASRATSGRASSAGRGPSCSPTSSPASARPASSCTSAWTVPRCATSSPRSNRRACRC